MIFRSSSYIHSSSISFIQYQLTLKTPTRQIHLQNLGIDHSRKHFRNKSFLRKKKTKHLTNPIRFKVMLINSFPTLQRDAERENDEIEKERKPRRARKDVKRKWIENQNVETVTLEVEIIYLLASKIYNTKLRFY